MQNQLLFISGPEIVVIFIFILLLFGAKKIPEIARGLGKGLNEFKKAANDIKKEINDSSGDIGKDIKDLKNNLK
ncbi:MAG: twin-arginine translocase TatA/TatE family subunit [Bacteroidales bacterium]|nr:twin-arginine translocase TatA/TatE family subunit [Bacteroidales bacterium]